MPFPQSSVAQKADQKTTKPKAASAIELDKIVAKMTEYCDDPLLNGQYMEGVINAIKENSEATPQELALLGFKAIFISTLEAGNIAKALLCARAINMTLANSSDFEDESFLSIKTTFTIYQFYLENLLNPNFLNSTPSPIDYCLKGFINEEKLLENFGDGQKHIPIHLEIERLKLQNLPLQQIKESLSQLLQIKNVVDSGCVALVQNEIETLEVYQQILALGDYSKSPHKELFDYLKEKLKASYPNAEVSQASSQESPKDEDVYKKIVGLAKENYQGKVSQHRRLLTVADGVRKFAATKKDNLHEKKPNRAMGIMLTSNFDPRAVGDVAFDFYLNNPKYAEEALDKDTFWKPEYHLRLAANHGNKEAQFLLAQFLDPELADKKLDGVVKNQNYAKLFYGLARKNGHENPDAQKYPEDLAAINAADPQDEKKFDENIRFLRNASLYSADAMAKVALFEEWRQEREVFELNFQQLIDFAVLYRLADKESDANIIFRKAMLHIAMSYTLDLDLDNPDIAEPEGTEKQNRKNNVDKNIFKYLVELRQIRGKIDAKYLEIQPKYLVYLDYFINCNLNALEAVDSLENEDLELFAPQSVAANCDLIAQAIKQKVSLDSYLNNFNDKLLQKCLETSDADYLSRVVDSIEGLLTSFDKGQIVSDEQKGKLKKFKKYLVSQSKKQNLELSIEEGSEDENEEAEADGKLGPDSNTEEENAPNFEELADLMAQVQAGNQKLNALQESLLATQERLAQEERDEEKARQEAAAQVQAAKQRELEAAQLEKARQEEARQEESRITSAQIQDQKQYMSDLLSLARQTMQDLIKKATLLEKQRAKQERRRARALEKSIKEYEEEDSERTKNQVIARETDETISEDASAALSARQTLARATAELAKHKATQTTVAEKNNLHPRPQLNPQEIAQTNELIKFCATGHRKFFLQALRSDDIKELLSNRDANILEPQTDEQLEALLARIAPDLTPQEIIAINNKALSLEKESEFFIASQKTLLQTFDEAQYLLLREQNNFPRKNCEPHEIVQWCGQMTKPAMLQISSAGYIVIKETISQILQQARSEEWWQDSRLSMMMDLEQSLETVIWEECNKKTQAQDNPSREYFEAIAKDENNIQDERNIAYTILAKLSEAQAESPGTAHPELVEHRKQQFACLAESIKLGGEISRQKAADACGHIHLHQIPPATYINYIKEFADAEIPEACILIVLAYLDPKTPLDEQETERAFKALQAIKETAQENLVIYTFKNSPCFANINQFENSQQLSQYKNHVAEELKKVNTYITLPNGSPAAAAIGAFAQSLVAQQAQQPQH